MPAYEDPSLPVENAGDVAGHGVVQCYAQDPVSRMARPVQELVGFERVHLEPGESARVSFELGASQFALHDEHAELVVEPGEIELRVGRSAEDVREAGSVEIVGEEKVVPDSGKRFFAGTSGETDR